MYLRLYIYNVEELERLAILIESELLWDERKESFIYGVQWMINYTRVVPLYTPGYTVGNYNNIIGTMND